MSTRLLSITRDTNKNNSNASNSSRCTPFSKRLISKHMFCCQKSFYYFANLSSSLFFARWFFDFILLNSRLFFLFLFCLPPIFWVLYVLNLATKSIENSTFANKYYCEVYNIFLNIAMINRNGQWTQAYENMHITVYLMMCWSISLSVYNLQKKNIKFFEFCFLDEIEIISKLNIQLYKHFSCYIFLGHQFKLILHQKYYGLFQNHAWILCVGFEPRVKLSFFNWSNDRLRTQSTLCISHFFPSPLFTHKYVRFEFIFDMFIQFDMYISWIVRTHISFHPLATYYLQFLSCFFFFV